MAKMDRDEYFMRIASVTALRGTCDRRQVGAVLVSNDRILSTGFNGAPRDMPECIEVGHMMEHGHCVRTIHAEANAIGWVGAEKLRDLVQRSDVTLYTTTSPCMGCMNQIINAHLQRIIYGERYSDPSHQTDKASYASEAARELGIFMQSFRLGG